MNTTKIRPRYREGKRWRRLARRLLGLIGITIEVYQPCRLGAVVVYGRALRGFVPQGPGLN